MTTTLQPPTHPRIPRPAQGTPTATPRRRWRPEVAGLVMLLGGTAVLYLWGLSASGWANSFYAAAAQAGSESWKAFFFGASDAAGSITVDKTPLSLWPMALSIRVFGLSSWSLLVPQALMGVASVALLHACVRRATGSAAAGLLAGAVLALTPVAVLMFRFDNPDASLVLLLIAAAWATLRALESPRALRWLVLAGVLVGLAFLSKMLQAFLVLPALALTYLLFARTTWGRRVLHLLAAFAAMVLAGGWWVAIVELWPASSRPYIGGSQDNSILELALGYNGLGRLSGEETGSVGGGMGWGDPGLLRMLGDDVGTQIAWLLPAALLLGAAALWLARRDTGSRAARAALVLWTGWLVVTGLTFSLMAGIFHAYYTVALAPAVAALVAIGGCLLWRRRAQLSAAVVLSATTALTCALACSLLGRSDWQPWLRYVVLGVGLAAALMLAGVGRLPRRLGHAVAAAALVASLAGPAAYATATAASPHTGSIPSAGPAGTTDGPGAGGPGGPGGAGGFPGGGATGVGGLLSGSTPTASVTAMLAQDASSYRWVAAAVGANSAAGYQLATGEPVIAIGGFNGTDPSPTLAQFQAWVADGDVHWFVAGGGGLGRGPGGAGGSGTAAQITAWVEATFTATTVDGVTMYDLSGGAA